MEPPWIKYPNIPNGSIGWRMGFGEDYRFAFVEWYTALDASSKAAVRERYPEPAEVAEGYPWTGYYARLEENNG